MLARWDPVLQTSSLILAFTFGARSTSGARISVIEKSATTASGFQEVYSQAIPWDDKYDDAATWWTTVEELIFGASQGLGNLDSVASICVSGTSASCLVIDRNTQKVTRPARMYNYDVLASRTITSNNNNDDEDGAVYGAQAVKILEKHAPPRHTARASTGSLAKLMAWAAQEPWRDSEVLCRKS
jgi:sugar (pentulose or hexulose) kinase